MGPWLVFGLTVALAAGRGEARRLLQAEALEEASALCRVELARHPGRGWAERCLVQATEGRIHALVEGAFAIADDGTVEAARPLLEEVRRTHRQALASGVVLAPLPDLESELRQRVAARKVAEGADHEASRRWREAAASYQASLAVVTDHPLAREGLGRSLREQVSGASGAERRELLDRLAELGLDPADRSRAADAWREVAEERAGLGDMRGAVEAWVRVVAYDPDAQASLAAAEEHARTDVVVRVLGDSEWSGTVRAGVVAALEQRGSRHLRVVSTRPQPRLVPGAEGPVELGPSTLLVRVRAPAVARGESTFRKVSRPRGAVAEVVQEGSRAVRVAVEVAVELDVSGERTLKTRLVEESEETARWEGRTVALRGMGGRRSVEGRRTGEQAPALADAEARAATAVITRLSATLAAEVIRQVDRQDALVPPRPAPPRP